MGTSGKVTDDGYASCSILPRIFKKDVVTLDNCIRARKGENVRTPGNRITEIGNILEEPLIIHGAKLLGLDDLEPDITQRFDHATLPLQASLDARAVANNLIIEDDPEKGIYTPGATKLLLNGKGVIENKVTRDFGEKDLPYWRGLMQMQGQLEVMGDDYTWGAVFVLYTSTDFKIFVYKKDPTFAAALATMINDFERRVVEEDYWPAKCATDTHIIFKDLEDKECVKDLDPKIESTVEELISVNSIIKDMEAAKEDLNTQLMAEMGNHVKGQVGNYQLSLPTSTRRPTARKVVPASPGGTFRAKTIRIKEKKEGRHA